MIDRSGLRGIPESCLAWIIEQNLQYSKVKVSYPMSGSDYVSVLDYII